MKRVIIYISVIFGLVAAAPKQENAVKDGPVVKTVCRADGGVYLPGETWTEQLDICVQYTCSDGGRILTNITGCMYKGVCMDFGPWNDECYRYECVQGNESSFYRLTGVGCKQTNGQCLEVGRRETIGCDVVECQIEGTSIISKMIQTGCSTVTGCKSVGQYWHDGCTVYTCALEVDQAQSRSMPHDKMRWPAGQYALLRPEAGCPSGIWIEGLRKHYARKRNYFSSPLSLSGIYAEEYFAHEFCVRQLEADVSPGYRTEWAPGSYCVFRSGGSCPAGFTEGYILLDDSNRKGSPYQSGTLPDGKYDANTGFFFCCRDDGPITGSIELPSENPFVLLMKNTDGCQSVQGMTSAIQTITFGGAKGPQHVQNGTVPYIQTKATDITLSICYYEPSNQCGCVDKSGEIIEANAEKTVDCVVKRCTSVNGKKVVEILKGGCQLGNGSCVPEGNKWPIFNNTACTRMTCARITTGDGVTFEARSIGEGCLDGSKCFAVGDEKVDNCYTSRCEMDKKSKSPSFTPSKADCPRTFGGRCLSIACPWHGTCKAANSTWVDRCTTYTCNVTSQEGGFIRNILPVEYGCDDGKGKCYKVGENVTDNCYDAVCRIAENKTVVFLDVIKGGCRWEGGCKKVHETWSHSCHDYRCEWMYTESGFSSVVNATNVSCRWNGKCYKQGTVWADGCVDYKCAVTRHQNEVSWKVETHKLACTDFNGKCVSIGHNFTDKCVKYTCNFRDNRIGMEPVSAGCQLGDRCVEEDQIYSDEERCVDYVCRKLARPNGAIMQLSVAQYNCLFNNTCQPENSTWEDGCRTRKCVILKTDISVQRSTAPVTAGCDDEGICRPVGYTKTTDTCTQYECEFKQEYRDAFFTLIGRACKATDGQCKPANATWEEMTSDLCVTYRCSQDGYMPTVSDQMCRDSNGKCQKVGNTGFPAVVKGQTRTNCACQSRDTPKQGVRIQCTG